MSHYIALILPTPLGEWRVLFPDVPGCETVGFTLEDARYSAVSALKQRVQVAGASAPTPHTLRAIADNSEWLSSNGVDLSQAIVEVVRVTDETEMSKAFRTQRAQNVEAAVCNNSRLDRPSKYLSK